MALGFAGRRLAVPRTIWDVVILTLGLNVWVGMLLLPALHVEHPRPGGVCSLLLVGLPLAVLIGGAARRARVALLGLYPLTLIGPIVADPRLAGINVYTPWTFALIAASLLGFLLATSFLLEASSAPRPALGRPLDHHRVSSRWRRRRRVYRALPALAALFPLVLLSTLFLHPGVQADLAQAFPGRRAEASALFGLLLLVVWLGTFRVYFVRPLKAHIRGDPELRYDLRRTRREIRRRQPRLQFYLFVGLALVLMGVMVLTHG